MHKTLKRFTTILLLSFFLIVSINFAVIAQDTQNKSQKPIFLLSSIDLWNLQDLLRIVFFFNYTRFEYNYIFQMYRCFP